MNRYFGAGGAKELHNWFACALCLEQFVPSHKLFLVLLVLLLIPVVPHEFQCFFDNMHMIRSLLFKESCLASFKSSRGCPNLRRGRFNVN